MFDHIGFGATDLQASKAFFSAALAPLGIQILMDFGDAVGWGRDRSTTLWLGEIPYAPTPVHLAFAAPTCLDVDRFYEAAIAAGGRDNGRPGIREQYHPNYYAAFVIAPDGHNIEAVCQVPA